VSCLPLEEVEDKKNIANTRSFGSTVYLKSELKEAVATYVGRAAEKLRRQGYSAKTMDVFAVTNGPSTGTYAYDPRSDHRYVVLEHATSFTNELITHALPLVEQLYRPGHKYLKAGVILGELVPDEAVQSSLFHHTPRQNQRQLMEVVDNLNFSMRDDMVKYVASGLKRNWKMRQELRSGRYTTRWEELFEIK
jgi:DNA polymerase V